MQKTTNMKMPDIGNKKCMLPAGGKRVQNVKSKSGLPTSPSGSNTNFGSKKR
jgi:hypothetical protein